MTGLEESEADAVLKVLANVSRPASTVDRTRHEALKVAGIWHAHLTFTMTGRLAAATLASWSESIVGLGRCAPLAIVFCTIIKQKRNDLDMTSRAGFH